QSDVKHVPGGPDCRSAAALAPTPTAAVAPVATAAVAPAPAGSPTTGMSTRWLSWWAGAPPPAAARRAGVLSCSLPYTADARTAPGKKFARHRDRVAIRRVRRQSAGVGRKASPAGRRRIGSCSVCGPPARAFGAFWTDVRRLMVGLAMRGIGTAGAGGGG